MGVMMSKETGFNLPRPLQRLDIEPPHRPQQLEIPTILN